MLLAVFLLWLPAAAVRSSGLLASQAKLPITVTALHISRSVHDTWLAGVTAWL